MSGILGVFTTSAGDLPDDSAIRRMLERMRPRGGDHTAILRDGFGVLAVVRHGWELAAGFSGPGLIVHEGDLTVVADAALYYREDLRRKLKVRGIRPTHDTPSHLILAAYRAWGHRCAEYLEGDWAFIVWDRKAHTVLCSRDFVGTRTLYYAQVGQTLIVATTMGAILAHPRCPQDLRPVALAEAAAGLLASSHETCYRVISLLSAGTNLTWKHGSARTHRFWHPPVGRESSLPFEDAADELRALLCRAVDERRALGGPTGVWLSGGYDSTAVFAAGEQVLRERGAGEHLCALSISHPPGDSGREDELITAVVNHWGGPIRWVERSSITMLDRACERAAERDDAFAHAFEASNRRLAQLARDTGCRVAFSGYGGDHLFQMSHIYLVDLFRTGRWRALAREWRAGPWAGTGFRALFRHAVQPGLPASLRALAGRFRGGHPLRGYLERELPDWIEPDFARRHGLLERERANTPKRGSLDYAAYEMYWYLTSAYWPRVASAVQGFALEHGVEIRSPLLDRRVIEFAAARAPHERRSGGETKRLLRRAMRGLLPEQVLAPRPHRTGTTHDHFTRSMREVHAAFVTETLNQPLALAELGIASTDRLRQRWDEYRRANDHALGLQLFFTLQVELWLRARNVQRTGTRNQLAPAMAVVV